MTSLIVYTICGTVIVAGLICVIYGLSQKLRWVWRAKMDRDRMAPDGLLGSSDESASRENQDPFMPEWFDPVYIESHLATIKNSPEEIASYFRKLESLFESVHERKVLEKMKEYHELMLSESAWEGEIQQARQELEDAKQAWRASDEDDLQQLLKWKTGS